MAQGDECGPSAVGTKAAALVLALADGRSLAYRESGDPDGIPVLMMHGFPGSRLDADVVDREARAEGVRIVCVDRPGIGRSDAIAGGSLTQRAADALAVADGLGIGRFGVLGYSAGGPFALALAAARPDRVAACALVSSPGPLDRWTETRGMSAGNRLLFGAGGRSSAVARMLVGVVARSTRGAPEEVTKRMRRAVGHVDRDVIDHDARAMDYARSWTECFRQGQSSGVEEVRALTRPWPFAEQEIATPVSVWHGADDRNVPVRHARELAARLPTCAIEVVEGTGHLLLLQEGAQILGTLADALRGSQAGIVTPSDRAR